ncbi:hypothetical protein [Hubei picorna-like virus 54]|uniref:hypothetical protein n=1 Tax=Hubei picorna-like virus 54 TaxID=1923136 RepID=UPI00090C5827|nr:hypothetical protein [Hubei picorna-like virus 54]APG78619.1 hypothetical protein [Hubei picorna-like virus 54]
MSHNRTTITTGSLLGTRAQLQQPTITPELITQEFNSNDFISRLLGDDDFEGLTHPDLKLKDASSTLITVNDIPTTAGVPITQAGHLTYLMDKLIQSYNRLPTMRTTVDAVLCKLSQMKTSLLTFSRETVIANILKGSDPLTRLFFERAVENHPYLRSLSNVDKIHTLKVILHTINVALLLINLITMFSQSSTKAVISLQIASIITSITIFLIELYSHYKRVPYMFNVEEMLTELIHSKLDSHFISRYDSRRNQILVDLFTNYGKRFDLPSEVLNVARDKLSGETADIIVCPEGSQYFDYAISVAEKTAQLLAKYPGIRHMNIINRIRFDPQIGDGLHNAFAHFTCVQELHPDNLKQLNLLEDDLAYWKLIIYHIKMKTPYKDLSMEGFPTLTHQFGSIGLHGWTIHTSQAEEASILPQIGKAACTLLALVSASLTTLTGNKSITSIFKKIKSFFKDWKDSKSLITGFKAAFIGLVYDMFGWDIGNLHAIKTHAKEIQKNLLQCSTLSPHVISCNPILKSRIEGYQIEATQILLDLKDFDSEDLKDMIRDLQILIANVSKILADSHVVLSTSTLRPIPVALYLGGHAGSGKTHFAQHILGPYLQDKLNISLPVEFSVDASGHFNLINPMEADHLFTDEVAASIDDPLVPCLNKLISETMFSAPGAFSKDIKLAPKIVTLCNNEEEITNASSKPKFLQALTSRLTQFRVTHNEYRPDGSQDRSSLTRMPNMENVTFQRIKTDIQGKTIETQEKLTAHEVCELVYKLIVAEQKAFERKQERRRKRTCETQGPFDFSLLDFSQSSALYKKYVHENLHILFALTKEFSSPNDLYPLSEYLKTQICVHLDNDEIKRIGSGSDVLCCKQVERNGKFDYLANKHLTTSQACIQQEKETLFLHIVGKPGTGKSTLIREHLTMLSEATSYEAFYATAFSVDVIKKDVISAKSPIILALDDYIMLKPADFQGLYDHIPKGSIVIFNSNIQFRDCSFLTKLRYRMNSLKYIDFNKSDPQPPIGWYRRLNLPFPILAMGQIVRPNYSTQIINIDRLEPALSTEKFKAWTEGDFFKHIVKPMNSRVTIKYSVLESEMPKPSTEVYLRFKNEAAFRSIMSSDVQAAISFKMALSGFNNKLEIKVGTLPTPEDLDSVEFPSFTGQSSLETYLLGLFPVFQKIFPRAQGATIKIDKRIEATLLNGSIFTTAANPLLQEGIEFHTDGIRVTRGDDNDFFTLDEVLSVISKQLTDITQIQTKHKPWSVLILLCNKSQIRQRFIQLGLVANSTYEINMEDPIVSKFKEIISSTPFKIFCGIFITIFTLITATSLVTLAYGVYKLFSGDAKDITVDQDDVFFTAQGKMDFDWNDDVDEAIEQGLLPKLGTPKQFPKYEQDISTYTIDYSSKEQLPDNMYGSPQEEKRTKKKAVSKKYGGTGWTTHLNALMKAKNRRLTPQEEKLAYEVWYMVEEDRHRRCTEEFETEEKHRFMEENDWALGYMSNNNPKLVETKIKANEIKKKHVNRYVSQMMNFEAATGQTTVHDFKINKLLAAQCLVQSSWGGLMGAFIGENYVATCSHIMSKEAFKEKKPLYVTEIINGQEKVWQAYACYHGFRTNFKNKYTDLLIAYIPDKNFQPKPQLLKYMKTVEEFVNHQTQKDILNTAVCYTTKDGLKREVLLQSKVLDTEIYSYDAKGNCDVHFNSPITSHEINSNTGITQLYNSTFVPGSCGLIVFTREEPSGSNWIVGMHASMNMRTKDIEAFPLYRDQIVYIIKKHKAELAKIGSLTPEDYINSFILAGIEPPPIELQKHLFYIGENQIACCKCFAKLNLKNYKIHECGQHRSQANVIVNYEFAGAKLTCDVPDWWKEILTDLIEKPRQLPECAIMGDEIVNTSSLKYLGKSWFKMPENIKPRYKLAPYVDQIPYPILKKPALLHPSQANQNTYDKLDNVYNVVYEGNKIVKTGIRGKSIQSSQIKLMTGGTTDELCKQFFGQHNFVKARAMFSDRFHKIVKQNHPNLKYRFLSLDEVINGITNQNHPLSKHIYNMDLDSEAGPTCHLLGDNIKGIKRDFFIQKGKNRDGSDRYELTPGALKYWARVRDNAKKGIVTFAPDHLKLKNENLKVEKADQGKTRAYVSRDMFGMMLEKTAFGFLQGLFHLDGCQNFSAIGCNPITDYPQLIQRFKNQNCTNLICYDVSRWDKNTLRILLEECFKAILEYLEYEFNITENQINTLKVAFAQILTTYFITGNEFYENGRSMPSGTYVTALMNTCLNEYLLCLFVAYKAEQEKRNPDAIMKLIASCFMGDDGVVAFPDSLIEFFDPIELQRIYKEMNVELTSTTKDGSDIGIVGLLDFEFCSRTVKLHQTSKGIITTFPLKEISVKSDSHWLTSNSTETKLSICRTKLYEACLHGLEFYESEVKCIKIILDTLPLDAQREIRIPSWEEQLDIVLFSASTELKGALQQEKTHQSQGYILTTAVQPLSPVKRFIMGNVSDSKFVFAGEEVPESYYSLSKLNTTTPEIDYISRVQEICQSQKLQVPEYLFQRLPSPDHIPEFACSAILEDKAGNSHYIIQESSTKKKAKVMVAKEFYHLLTSSRRSQMDATKPAATAVQAGDASFESMLTTAPTAAPTEIIQPSLEQLTDVLNYGDPRELIDVIKTQIFPIRDITFNAAATPGSIIAKIPYGPEYLPTVMAEYFAKHKYFKGMFYHTLVLYSNATVTGAIRISHVKDIDKDVYTRTELVETNHSELVQLNQISMTANTARNWFIDYAAQADKVLPTKEILEGTYKWVPSRPGIIVTMEVPVQQIYGQNLNLTLQHYTGWGNLVVSTPILTPASSGIKPGTRTMLEAMQGMSLNTIVSSLEPGLLDGDIELTTDGCAYPSTIFTKTREYSTGGIEIGRPAQIEIICQTGVKLKDEDPWYRVEPKLANACMSTAELKSGSGTVYARLFLLEGEAPIKFENIKDHDSFEKCLTTGYRTATKTGVAFPFPDKDFANTDSTLASIQQAFIDTYNERCTTSLQTFSSNPFKLSGIKTVIFDKNDTLREGAFDMTKRAHNIATKAIIFNIGTLSFRLFVMDVDFEVVSGDWMFGYNYSDGKYVIHDFFTVDYTPPTTGVSTIPLVSSWQNFSRLPSGCKTFMLVNPKTSAITTPNGNEGLPTVMDTKFTTAFMQFLDINTPAGQLCRMTIMQSGTGRVVATLYYSTEYKQLFIYAPTTATQYAAYIGQPSSSYVISNVSFQSPSESFISTDDSSWSNRQVTPSQRKFYRSQMMLATALQAGLGAVGGIASGINAAVQQQQDFKRQQMLQQERLDYMNRWNELSANTQMKTNEITNATNLAMNQGSNLTTLQVSQGNNANAYAIAQLQNGNRIDLAKISQDTSLAGFANQKDIALTQQATQLGAKAVDLQIAQGNNATTIEAANIASETATVGNVLNFTGGLANTGVGIAKVVTDYLQGDKERENRLDQIHVRGDETRKTIDHNLAMRGGNIAASQ